jgi:hypothetical protein
VDAFASKFGSSNEKPLLRLRSVASEVDAACATNGLSRIMVTQRPGRGIEHCLIFALNHLFCAISVGFL